MSISAHRGGKSNCNLNQAAILYFVVDCFPITAFITAHDFFHKVIKCFDATATIKYEEKVVDN